MADQAVRPGDQPIIRGSAYAAVSRNPSRSAARRADQRLAVLSPALQASRQTASQATPQASPQNPPHEIHPTKSTPRNPPHEITARFRRDPGSLRDFAGTPGRGAISQAPPSPREWPCPSSWSSALPNAARPPLGTSRDGGTRPRWRGYATRRARCLAIGPPAGRSGRDVRRRGSPAARGARGWPGSPERGNFAPSTPRRLWPR
jgi:hypothetical protein